MQTAFIQLHTEVPLHLEETVSRSLEFVKRFPRFAPQRIDHGEPPQFPFDPAAFPAVCRKEDYQRGWIWERDNPFVHGQGITNEKTTFESITVDLNGCSQDEVISLLIWSVQRQCVTAHLQVLSLQEVRRGLPTKNVWPQGRFNGPEAERDQFNYEAWWFSRSLAYGLPDLPWITVFGPRYVRFFSKERLLSAPAYRAEEVAQDTVLIQLCENYHEINTHWDHFNATREAVIDHLGRLAFSRLRQPGDPPPTWERDALMDVGEENVPPEFLPIRRRDEKIFAERPVLPEPLTGLADMLANAKRLKVATVGDSRVLIDTARKEMIGFADRAQADDWIGKLIAAGAVVKAKDAE